MIENCGPVAAEVVSSEVTGLGAGRGSDELTVDPVIPPNEVRDLDFDIDDDAKARLRADGEVEVTLIYVATATGRQFRTVERVRCKKEGPRTECGISHGPRERWLLVEAGTPKPR